MNIPRQIEVRGARENNLKNINVDIPLYQSTVVIGVSGSGKSSLVYDTIYNESQRIFLENLAVNKGGIAFNRPAKVDIINHLPAAFSVSQHSYNQNPRSTVGTYTNLSDYIRSIFAIIVKFDHQINLKPNDFSFNNPQSACKTCKGTGEYYKVDKRKVIPNPAKSLEENAILWFKGQPKSREFQLLKLYCEQYDIPMNIPFKQLTVIHRNKLLYEESDETFIVKYKTSKNRYKTAEVTFIGAMRELENLMKVSDTPSIWRKIQKYLSVCICPMCKGMRLNQKLLQYKVAGLNFSEVEQLYLQEMLEWLKKINASYVNTNVEGHITELSRKIEQKINSMIELSLSYLSLNRTIPTLSGGEMQRVRIANQLNNPLTGLLYIFDEPCKGLHVRDIDKILKAISGIVKKGNTVLAIEHNKRFIDEIENKIYIGPVGGKDGGYIVDDEAVSNDSVLETPVDISLSDYIDIVGVEFNNLQNLNVQLPAFGITAITGISGSGKSSLLTVIEKSIGNQDPLHCTELKGGDFIKRVHRLTQKPIHQNSRSKVGSYLGVLDELRELLAATEISKKRGYTAAYFSPNISQGRCESCKGHGEQRVDIPFLEDIYIACEDCVGTGFKKEILEVTYEGFSITELLNTEINQIIDLFNRDKRIYSKLSRLIELGMGYITLGQPSASLSGGEAQRVKLAKILGEKTLSNCLYLLDEPTAGLSMKDTQRLQSVLNGLAKNNCIVIVEHNIDFVKATAHYVIDMGLRSESFVGKINVSGVTPEVYNRKGLSFI
ncbi:ATP-binding cassette domain-containing protein [Bacillus paramycoides]|uniref:ATP-binding cassette domain-containing protein n=1 Tax=Bacillus paramycoides TaxID=2026194 RepID=UPI002E22678D|nr:ATP-binding cassette domain-containing protein [Bacillus paramycoides]MED0986684.1 ATP-binding cassette domain-containing protein [Bacillus paramycoides]